MHLNNYMCNKITTSHTTSRTGTNHTHREGVVETSEEEVEEEDLEEEDVKLCDINVDNWFTTPNIA